MASETLDAEPREVAGGSTIPVIDPSTGETFGQIKRGTAKDIDAAVKRARRAFEGGWERTPAFERGRILMRLSGLVQEHFDALWRLESRDTGKPAPQAKSDISACARYCEYYAGAADKLHGETVPYHDGFTVITLREPHGVTGHIIPWNYPAQIFGRSVVAALAAGNACVVKPAEDACQSILRLAELALEAGLPEGVLNVVTGYGEEAGAALAGHPDIDHISFTGSPAVGTLVQGAAALHNRPVTMELGGKSPQLVFADADLESALPSLVNAVIQNAGQTCSAGSRLLVERSAYDAVMERLAESFGKLRTGAATQGPDCGPLISARQKGRVQGFLDRVRADGLEVVAQGTVADAPAGGFYVLPTLVGNVPPEHPLAQQEVFGPVLAATPFEGEDEAVALANGTDYGLLAGVWTADGGRQMRLARRLKAGQVYVNNYGAGGGIELPFGGVKRSGFGREKGFEGLKSFTVLKTVTFKHG
ncbi:MAG: aldehyde dehydrogenase family protein [Deinococcota bacterium]|jgi:aldehyde dehydrogenase (NAD+)|nr:aldehyde dehydrogenase family protein [Deinococcota bacterium]